METMVTERRGRSRDIFEEFLPEAGDLQDVCGGRGERERKALGCSRKDIGSETGQLGVWIPGHLLCAR